MDIRKDPRIKKAYVCLDSKYARFSDDLLHLTWDFENSLVESDNSTNVACKVQNITAMRMYSVMTYQPSISNTRFTMLIEEFQAQSFMMPSGRRFHFVGLVNDITNGPIDLGSRNAKVVGSSIRVRDFTLHNKYEFLSGHKFNDGIYRFNNPIKHVDTLTVSFANYDTMLPVPKYLMSGVTWTVTQPDVLRLNLTFPEPHNHFSIFTSPTYTMFVDGLIAPGMQALADYVNSAEHTIWEIVDIYTISIKLMVDAKAGDLIAGLPAGIAAPYTIVMPSPVEPVTVRFNAHRLIIGLELDYISDDPEEAKYSIQEIADVIPRAMTSKLKYKYLMLDSNNAYAAESTTSKFTWLLNDKVPTLSTGYINISNPLHNIVKARLGRMTFNNMSQSFIDDVNNRNRYGFGFNEFVSQAMVNPLNTKFQFIEFLPEYDATRSFHATLSPFNENRGWFRFREKFNILDKLTLTITNLITDEVVSLPPSTPLTITGIQTFNTITVTVGATTYTNILVIEDLLPPGPVVISGFTTDDPVTDAALIAAYNTTQTLLLPDVATYPTYYYSPIDISSATFTGGTAEVPVSILCTVLPDPRFVGVLELLCDESKSDESKSNKITRESLTVSKLNPIIQFKYAYVLLDTNNIDTNLSSDTKFGWNFVPNAKLSTGTVNSTTSIKDLVGMRIFPITSNFIAPITEPGKTLVNDVSNMGYNFTVLIHEFSAQSFVGRNGFKYHFILYPQLMNPTNQPNSTSYTPADPYFEYTTSGKGNGWFWFRKPITTFSTLSVSMGNPFDYVKQTNVTRVLIPLQLVFLG